MTRVNHASACVGNFYDFIAKVIPQLSPGLQQEGQQLLDDYRGDQADPELLEAAQDIYETDDLEIDEGALTSEGDRGTWVQAWVWVSDDEYDEEDESNVGDDLCDTCMRSGVVVYRTDENGNTICVDCDDDEEEPGLQPRRTARYLMQIETDDDFTLMFRGRLYRDGETLELNDVTELDAVEICGPFGSERDEHTKCYEFEQALRYIKQRPDWAFDNTGGNRGVSWYPIQIRPDQMDDRWWMNEEEQDETR